MRAFMHFILAIHHATRKPAAAQTRISRNADKNVHYPVKRNKM
jgi:hypothetical protein